MIQIYYSSVNEFILIFQMTSDFVDKSSFCNQFLGRFFFKKSLLKQSDFISTDPKTHVPLFLQKGAFFLVFLERSERSFSSKLFGIWQHSGNSVERFKDRQYSLMRCLISSLRKTTSTLKGSRRYFESKIYRTDEYELYPLLYFSELGSRDLKLFTPFAWHIFLHFR